MLRLQVEESSTVAGDFVERRGGGTIVHIVLGKPRPDDRHVFGAGRLRFLNVRQQVNLESLLSIQLIRYQRVHGGVDVSIAKLESLSQDSLESSASVLGYFSAGPILYPGHNFNPS